MKRAIWRLRLLVAIPMVVFACCLDDAADAIHRFAERLARLSYRVEGDEPEPPVDSVSPRAV